MHDLLFTENISFKKPGASRIDWLFRKFGYEKRQFFEGVIRFRELPEPWTPEEYAKWYPKMKERERERYTRAMAKNVLCTAGRAQILAYIGASSQNVAPFSMFFGTGTGALAIVLPGDTFLANEIFRNAPATSITTGTQIDISTQIGTTQSNGTLTNAGFFGINATSTPGSGTLMTHALVNNFVKANGLSYSADYLINLT